MGNANSTVRLDLLPPQRLPLAMRATAPAPARRMRSIRRGARR